MTTTTNGVTATLPAGYTVPSTAQSTSQVASDGVNSNTFLQLLVAQLQYQDPSNPADSTQMLAQTAAFEEVSQLNTMQTSIAGLLSQQQATAGASMLGQDVTGTTTAGGTVSGTVTAVQLTSTGPELTVGGQQVPLSGVTSITAAGSSTGGGSSAGTGTGSSAVTGSSDGTGTISPATTAPATGTTTV